MPADKAARRPGDRHWAGSTLRRGAGIGLRALAGIGGGYGIAALATASLSVGLPMPRAEAVLAATMASFAIYTGAILWAFAARGLPQVWMGTGAVAGGLGLWLLVLQGGLP